MGEAGGWPNVLGRPTPGGGPRYRPGVETIVSAIRRRLVGRGTPLCVALDGRNGAGKSTLAADLVLRLQAVLVASDDFFAYGVTDVEWDERTPSSRALDAIDWRRLRRTVLEPLRRGQRARWHSFDFEAGVRPDGTCVQYWGLTERSPRPVIILEGAYSTRPQLADLIDLTILVDAPAAVRHARLAARETSEFLAQWHARWGAAEEYYFTAVRPPASFDLIVATEAGPRIA
jgi:uridine kinase